MEAGGQGDEGKKMGVFGNVSVVSLHDGKTGYHTDANMGQFKPYHKEIGPTSGLRC